MSDQYLDLLHEINAKLDKLVSTSPDVPSPVSDIWWRPTPSQLSAFAAKVGLPASDVSGWTGNGTNTAQKKIAPLPGCPASPSSLPDPEAAKEYASFGYRPDGTHYLWTAEWLEAQRQLCDKIHACSSAAEANNIVSGASDSGVTEEAVEFAIMTGLVELKPFMPATFRFPLIASVVNDQGQTVLAPVDGHAQTVADVATYLALPAGGPNGPGPSGQ